MNTWFRFYYGFTDRNNFKYLKKLLYIKHINNDLQQKLILSL